MHVSIEMNFYCTVGKGTIVSGVVFLVVMPAIIAFLFAVFVAYFALSEANERQLNLDSNAHSLEIEVPPPE